VSDNSMRRFPSRSALALLIGLGALPAAAAADDVAGFFQGKQVQLIIGFGPGVGFDTYARLAAQHLTKFIPGQPNVIVQNMPGAGSLRALNYGVNAAAKDGTVLVMPNPVAVTVPLLYPDRAKFDAQRFSWIGSMNSEVSTCGFWSKNVGSLADLMDPKRETIVGATGASGGSATDAKTLQKILGFSFRIVTGYPAMPELQLAAQNGEVEGFCGLQVSVLKAQLWDQYKSRTLKVPIQIGVERHADLPDVANAFDLAKSPEDKQFLLLTQGPWAFGRPILAPPGVPTDRVAAIRKAFEQMMRDPAFLADAERLKLEMRPMSADRVAELVAEIYKAPATVIERAKQLLGEPQ
jgi:tripartite-type tricarboxylate transporter receptor subunit TctC